MDGEIDGKNSTGTLMGAHNVWLRECWLQVSISVTIIQGANEINS